tara:strand:+ start:302 stop:622 length:321 start_codon:yes stop_codon:yes gene_type:complete
MKKLLKNSRGEYNYHFNWVDCEGAYTGFNDVWATNKLEAIKKAKARETKAHWAWYNGTKYVDVPEKVTTGGHCFYNKGMYVDTKSMYKATAKQADEMNRIGWMMTM